MRKGDAHRKDRRVNLLAFQDGGSQCVCVNYIRMIPQRREKFVNCFDVGFCPNRINQYRRAQVGDCSAADHRNLRIARARQFAETALFS